MKKIILWIFAILASSVASYAQHKGSVEVTGDLNYQHFFLKDDADVIKYSGGFVMQFGADYHITDSFYAGTSLGFSLGVVTSEYSGMESWSEVYDIRLPLHAGIASTDGKFKLDTGPFIDFSIGGKTEIKYDSFSSDKTVTRLKDMDVNRVSLGWGVSVKLFKYLKVGYGIKLTDSAYGEGGHAHVITIGYSF